MTGKLTPAPSDAGAADKRRTLWPADDFLTGATSIRKEMMSSQKTADAETPIRLHKKIEALEQQARDLARSVETVRLQTLAQSTERIEALEQRARDLARYVETTRLQTLLQSEAKTEASEQKARDLADYVETLRIETHLQAETETDVLGQQARDLAAAVEAMRKETLLQSDAAIAALGQQASDLAAAVETVRQETLLQSDNEIAALGQQARELAVSVEESRLEALISDKVARRLNEELGQRVRERTGQLATQARLASLQADVGVALTSSTTLHAMLQRCSDSMVRNLDAAFSRIWMLNEAGDMLELQASAGMYTHLDGPHGRVPVGQFKIGLIAEERRPHLTNAVIGDPRVSDQDWAVREGMVAFAGYPLLVADRLIGVVALFARQILSDATMQALAAIADQIALGIDRMQTEKAMRAAQHRLRHVLVSSPSVLFTFSVQTQSITWASDNLPEVLGYSPEAALGQDWWLGNVHPDDRDQVIAQFQTQLLNHERSTYEYRFRHGDGSYRWTRCEIRLVRDADGQPVEAVGSWSDITERKQLEEQYRQAQKMEAVGKLAGGVAHDFNNLLTVIMGYSQMFLGKLRPEDPFRIPLTEIYKAGERATGLTRQLLAFSRKQVLMPVVLDLSTIIADMEKMLRRLIGEDVILTFLAGADLWKVKADPGQMEQVVMNILVNARDAMPEGGKVLLETRNVELDNHYVQTHPDAKPGEHVLLAISDSGCGMNASVKARIFEPFFTTKGPTKGTGLGLATVFGIVKQSGGHIDVYSEVGQGTTFKIYLPRDKSGEPIASRSRIIEPVRGGTETILLVEDEEGVRNLAGTVLQQRGYKVLDAMNGGEALVICETLSQPIDLMITDVVMPHFSGRQLADRLATRQPTMKVLYMSGYTDDAIVHHGVLESGIPFLQKPFAPEALARKVREVLDNILGQTIPSAPDNKTTGNQ